MIYLLLICLICAVALLSCWAAGCSLFAVVGVTGGDCMPLSIAEVVPVEAVLVVTIDVGLEVTLGVVEVAPGLVVMALALGVSIVAMVVMVAGAVKIITSVDSEELTAGLTSPAVAVVSISLVVE